MTDKFSQNGALSMTIRLSLENAERFLDDAVLLMNDSSFGHAFALLILALEEIGKAIYCNWAMNGFVKINNSFLRSLRNHKTKHKVIKELEKLITLKTEIDNYKASKNRRKIAFKSLPEAGLFLTKLESSFQFKSNESFFGAIEDMKRLGFYVDVDKNCVPSSPTIFTKDICDSYLTFVKTIFMSAKDKLLANNKD